MEKEDVDTFKDLLHLTYYLHACVNSYRAQDGLEPWPEDPRTTHARDLIHRLDGFNQA